MSRELIARIRKNRELRITVEPFVFVARRPTDAEATELFKLAREDSALLFQRIAIEYVVGWEKVTENDVVGGGGTDPPTFDAGLWREWCADRKEFWEPIASAVVDAYKLHADRLEDAAKN